jgi:hypothetical protein
MLTVWSTVITPSFRLSTGCLLLSIGLFISGNIFLWTSTHTCKRYSPLQWWAVMTVIAVGYVLIVEVIAILLVVCVFGGPVVRVFIRAGHVEREEGRMAFPKPPAPMSRSEVEKIPVVVYVPALEDEKDIGMREAAEVVPSPRAPKRFRISNPQSPPESNSLKVIPPKREYDRKAYDYPPHEISPSLASCSICLLEFEEPRPRYENGERQERLRLLPCGHVYHVSLRGKRLDVSVMLRKTGTTGDVSRSLAHANIRKMSGLQSYAYQDLDYMKGRSFVITIFLQILWSMTTPLRKCFSIVCMAYMPNCRLLQHAHHAIVLRADLEARVEMIGTTNAEILPHG